MATPIRGVAVAPVRLARIDGPRAFDPSQFGSVPEFPRGCITHNGLVVILRLIRPSFSV